MTSPNQKAPKQRAAKHQCVFYNAKENKIMITKNGAECFFAFFLSKTFIHLGPL